jgi:hypothetical protein
MFFIVNVFWTQHTFGKSWSERNMKFFFSDNIFGANAFIISIVHTYHNLEAMNHILSVVTSSHQELILHTIMSYMQRNK